ncbi:MAG: ASCH domain-containing protein [Nanoarchaeota archaeon]
MKKLKFAYPLPELVLNSLKDTTWRLNDEKELSVNDELSLCYGDGENKEREFGKAKIIWIKETTFENLTKEDKEGHEKFNSEEEMYKTYSRYYNIEVKPETKLKVVKFKLL